MRSTDLTGLFAGGPEGMGAQFKIVQGQLVEFDPSDGSNIVTVNGAALTNVAMLLTGAEVNFAGGDAVLLLVLGNTYMIMGKVATVGSQTFGSASMTAYSDGASTNSFTYSTANANQTILTTNVPVPAWADFAVVTLLTTVAFTASGTAGTFANTTIQNTLQGVAAGGGTGAAIATHQVQTTSVGGTVWDLSGSDYSNGLTATAVFSCSLAGSGNYSQLSMTAIYGRNSS